MSTKFLGLDSINVLHEYIKQYVAQKQEDSQVITLQVYKYIENHVNEEDIDVPTDVTYNFESNEIEASYDSWNSLLAVMDYITRSTDENGLGYEYVSDALVDGSIWMRSAQVSASSEPSLIDWSAPMKVSGQNGKNGSEFSFSYEKNTPIEERSLVPLQLDEVEHPVIYYWMKNPDGKWFPEEGKDGFVWAIYAKNGVSGMKTVFQYHVTLEKIEPTHDSPYWMNGIAYGENGFSQEVPYLWMRYKTIPANKAISWTDPEDPDSYWSEVILFSHYGQDGKVPNYNITFYKRGLDSHVSGTTPGIVAPEPPVLDEENADYIKFREDNPDWLELPETEEGVIWWQCTVHINGQEVKVLEIGPVVRYNQVEQEAVPGEFTKYLYRWSPNQNKPEIDLENLEYKWKPKDWNEDPAKNALEEPNASLWMISALADGYSDSGYPKVTKNDWSNPVKISGPRGPVAYDYRVETRYMEGTEKAPRILPTEGFWYKLNGELNITSKEYPYIWAADYLVLYKMKYVIENGKYKVDAETGEYIIEPDENSANALTAYGYYKISGKDGEDGNKKNSVLYTTSNASTINIKSFIDNNMYICNASGNTEYNITWDLQFIDGYTAKFANIGTGTMTIKANNVTFVNSTKTSKSITLYPNESIEIICYNDSKQGRILLVLGKTL